MYIYIYIYIGFNLFISQVKRPQSWLLKLFFAASCGFAVPVRSFISLDVFGRAALFSLAAVSTYIYLSIYVYIYLYMYPFIYLYLYL